MVEFQAQPSAKALYNLNTKIGLFGEEHLEREVLGIAVFLRATDIPDYPSWVHEPGSPIRCVALNSFLRDQLAHEPDNLITPIQETKAYQSIFAEGEGRAKRRAKPSPCTASSPAASARCHCGLHGSSLPPRGLYLC
ncbi:Rpn family recombination-promoting nuclease/putative transposase [Rhabdochromatium marinum]|uniref:Rpn family recombination-promoting nuclease/putative transposase n=1 Tax=Rhabdochromatium marinum TaxID=48729 RepID=UPI001F5BFC41|nr:Rpn family recombination-promoting nuclease/putative transposase [Rhabdochromatium marinum]